MHDAAGATEEMNDAKEADCTALRPLALKLAKAYKPCALVVKKTELMEGVGDTHGLRPRRKEDISILLTGLYECCNITSMDS